MSDRAVIAEQRTVYRAGGRRWLTDQIIDRGAELSPDGRYRYALWRRWSHTLPLATFVMLNPSTADAETDDATIRKCCGFAERWGLGGIWVVNLFAFRSRDPSALVSADDPVGPDNDEWLNAAADFDDVIVAWGATGGPAVSRLVARRLETAWPTLVSRAHSVRCLGVSADGSPRHPLMLSYATVRQPWEPRHG